MTYHLKNLSAIFSFDSDAQTALPSCLGWQHLLQAQIGYELM